MEIDIAYQKYHIEIPDIYTHIKRTGCMGCPYGHFTGDTQKELNLMTTAQKQYVVGLFEDSYKVLGIDY